MLRSNVALVMFLAGCTGGPKLNLADDGGHTGLTIDGGLVLGGVAIVNGDYNWTVVEPPRPGPETYNFTVVSENDVLMIGNGIRHWNGTAVQEVVPWVDGVWYLDSGKFLDHIQFMDSVAVVAPNDIWACGTRMMHYDGAVWTDHTADFGPTIPAASFNQWPCSVSAGAGKLYVSGAPGLRTHEEDGGWHSLPGNFRNQATHANVQPSAGCVVAGPAGELAVLNLGVLTETTDLQTGWSWVDVAPGLGNEESWRCDATRTGATFYEARLASSLSLEIYSAAFPGDFHVVATIGAEKFEAAGIALAQAPYQSQGIVKSVVPPLQGSGLRGTDVLFVMRAVDLKGHPLSVLVEFSGTTARILPERFYGWEFMTVAGAGDSLLIAAQGGALLKGVRR